MKNRFQRAAVCVLTFAALFAPTASWAQPKLTVVVAAIDSLMPHEVDPVLMPTVYALREQGTWYEQSRSVFSGETIPNHVAMVTGMYPENNGIPTNKFWNRVPGDVDGDGTGAYEDDLALPTELESLTLFDLIPAQCDALTTGNAMSKDYLYAIFSECDGGGPPDDLGNCPDAPNQLVGVGDYNPLSSHRQADYHWASPLYIPESGHILDVVTGEAALRYLNGGAPSSPSPDPLTPCAGVIGGGPSAACGDQIKDDQGENNPPVDFLFINFGDVDRLGHTDPTGSLQANIDPIDDVLTTGVLNLLGSNLTFLEDLGFNNGISIDDLRARSVALAEADSQIRLIQETLTSAGRWQDTILILASDHGMDWKPVDENFAGVNMDSALTAAGFTDGMREVANAGTTGLYLETRTTAESWQKAAEVLVEINRLIQTGEDGEPYHAEFAYFVYDPTGKPAPESDGPLLGQQAFSGLFITDENGTVRPTIDYIRANLIPNEEPTNLGRARHENLGDIVVSAKKGFAYDSPLPGNHGHRITLHNTLLVSGGSTFVKRGQSIAPPVGAPLDSGHDESTNSEYEDYIDHLYRFENQSENIDVAPTVAWLLGMDTSNFDGRVLFEAFDLNQRIPTAGSCGNVSMWNFVSVDEARELAGEAPRTKPRCKGCKVESNRPEGSKGKPRCKGCKVE